MARKQKLPSAQKQRAAESEKARQAAASAKRNMPNEIAERALMQRQGKGMHKQDHR
jgi:hypothetical protein